MPHNSIKCDTGMVHFYLKGYEIELLNKIVKTDILHCRGLIFKTLHWNLKWLNLFTPLSEILSLIDLF